MQLRNRITVVRKARIHHLHHHLHHQFVKGKAQNAVVPSLEVADGMAETTFKQLGSDSTSFRKHSICIRTFGAFGTESYNECR